MVDDLHESLCDEIDAQITTLSSGAPATRDDGTAWTSEDLARALEQLASDK